jgi:hypothetical protein
MQLQNAKRSVAIIKIGLQGPSGGGKTYSALLLAYGLCKDWSKIAVIDSENKSSHLYSHLGKYQVLNLDAPYNPERYIQAIDVCLNASIEVIILDSITHEWEAILDIHSNMMGNSFTNWAKLTPRHNDFIQKILQSPVHFIATIRAKQDYILSEKNGKQVPEKVGLKGITREGMDYELTLVFEIDIKHHAHVSKDRTRLFTNTPEFIITEKTGECILQWCNQTITADEVKAKIEACITLTELTGIFNTYPEYQTSLLSSFSAKKTALNNNLITTKIHINGNNGNNTK